MRALPDILMLQLVCNTIKVNRASNYYKLGAI